MARKSPVENARLTGYGMIDPGAGANRASEDKMDKTERNYVKSRGRVQSSYEAVRRARRANKQKSLDEE